MGYCQHWLVAVKSLKNYKTFTHVTFETKMINSKNDEVALEISGKALLNSQGKLIGLQGTTMDITKRKQVEKELAKYRDHLEELVRKRTAELDNRVSEVEQLNIEMVNLSDGLKTSNKSLEATTGQLTAANKELEAFAYSVSHDLRAPLRNIDGFSQILLEDYSDILDKQGRHYLQRVRAGTQNMGQLIDDILSLSRSGRHHMDKKTINMESIVREVYTSLKNELKDRKVDLVVHKCPPALADSHLVKIVFTNLLTNALKFTRIRENAKIETGSMTEDGHTVFFIKDNGAGFDMKYADKLFIAFQRLHRAEEYEGSGIGLAIVQRIIHRHGGRIWAESKIDVGTTFYFTFSV
jgi:light-regulated signal transduction histidine kinase (bacteriophytochrome)